MRGRRPDPDSSSATTSRGAVTGVAPSAAAASPGRDMAIDVMRGLCIVSMTTAHLAAGSWPFQATHFAILVDGAVGFVLLSGLVVGMTQRRTIERVGLLGGERRLFRRTAVVYAAHLALCVVAFAVVALDPSRIGPYVSVEALGGPLPATIATLGLQVNPHYTSILSLYVVLLLLGMAAVAALAHRQVPLVVIGSLALYGAGFRWPATFNFSSQPGVPGAVNWATWQLLFIGALLVGWYWRTAPVRWALASRASWCSAALLVIAGAAIGWWMRLGADTPWKSVLAHIFSEGTLGPGTILLAFAASAVIYPPCRWLVRRAGPLLSPIARIGRHSLDCYLILSVAVIVLPSVFRYDTAGLLAVGVTVDLLVVMFLWCVLRDRTSARHQVNEARNGGSVEGAGSAEGRVPT